MRRLIPIVLCISLPLAAQASPDAIAKIRTLAEQDSQVAAYLDHLTNRIGPRLTSSDNLTLACEWARDEFKEMGLDARIEQWGTFPVGFNRGAWFGKVNSPEKFSLTFNTQSWSAGTHGPTTGPVRLAPKSSSQVEDLSDEEIRGHWFIDPPRSKKITRTLMERGAHGFLRGGRELLLTGGNSKIDFEKLPDTPTAYLLPADYQRLKGLMGGAKPVEVTLDIRNHFKRGPIPLYNVIAEIKGSKFPDQYIIVGGHIDSWDGATGTTDNGTGVATTLEAARLLTTIGAKPLRTIRFMLWSGEEQGLLGSKGYMKMHPEELDRVSAVLVHDGGTNYLSGIAGMPAMMPVLSRVFAPIEELAPDRFPFKISQLQSFFPIGSDHDSYLAKGVPGFFWRQAGTANYQTTHHTQYDTFNMANQDYQRHSSLVAAIGALGLANEEEMLTREGLKYRSFRGRNRPQRRGPNRTLGVTVDENFVIGSVVDASVASKTGLLAGDKILAVGKDLVEASADLSRALRNGPRQTNIKIKRGAKEMTLKVEFAK